MSIFITKLKKPHGVIKIITNISYISFHIIKTDLKYF